MNTDKLILTDIDGVVLNFDLAFAWWMKWHHQEMKIVEGHENDYKFRLRYGIDSDREEELFHEFDHSGMVERMPPFRDAIWGIRELHEKHGFVFYAITKCGRECQVDRRKNLDDMFGKSCFIDLECIDINESKQPYLNQFKDTGFTWIEDNMQNAQMGVDVGLDVLLMDHPYNHTERHFKHPDPNIKRVLNWKEIVEHVVG